MLQAADLIIRLNAADDVVIARVELPAGTELIKEKVRVSTAVPAGHKVATRDIAQGAPVRRYNQIIGFAKTDIAAGQHIHSHNLGMGDFERDYGIGLMRMRRRRSRIRQPSWVTSAPMAKSGRATTLP